MQRAGRAGRVTNGYVYRLYTFALFGSFSEQTMPEILRIPLEKIVLELKVILMLRICLLLCF